jgi:hypothetical protein
MSDDPQQSGAQDGSRININQDHEVRYWTKALGISDAQLFRAVGVVGVSSEKVRAYFRDQTSKAH